MTHPREDYTDDPTDNEEARMAVNPHNLDEDALEVACKAFCGVNGMDPDRLGICSKRPIWALYKKEITAAIFAYEDFIRRQDIREKVLADAESDDLDDLPFDEDDA